VERSQYEMAWFRVVAEIVPQAVPRLLGCDPAHGLFALEYLAPESYRLWREELRAGRADTSTAAEVGRRLALIHTATAGRGDIARAFPTDHIFHAIRLEPYLEATARRHPDLSALLLQLSHTTAGAKHALVHGDVSPKNILIGPAGPVFLDAECAWYGDPAFDLAFCLNHLLLKCIWTRESARDFLDCFDSLSSAYRAGVTWEAVENLEARAAALLPALFLARVDGKSPVDYIDDETDKERVRRVGRALIRNAPARLDVVRRAWSEELGLDG
jgi:aminoglycoside phosphotransferase (APT) family kinase protein